MFSDKQQKIDVPKIFDSDLLETNLKDVETDLCKLMDYGERENAIRDAFYGISKWSSSMYKEHSPKSPIENSFMNSTPITNRRFQPARKCKTPGTELTNTINNDVKKMLTPETPRTYYNRPNQYNKHQQYENNENILNIQHHLHHQQQQLHHSLEESPLFNKFIDTQTNIFNNEYTPNMLSPSTPQSYIFGNLIANTSCASSIDDNTLYQKSNTQMQQTRRNMNCINNNNNNNNRDTYTYNTRKSIKMTVPSNKRQILEEEFRKEKYPSNEKLQKLSIKLNMRYDEVQNYFKKRRKEEKETNHKFSNLVKLLNNYLETDD